MKILALETAVSPGSIALASQTASEPPSIDAFELPPEERTARSLAPAIDRLLSEFGWRAGDLDAVAVTTGPGSFTGLRIGVTAAKTIAYAAGAECIAINTLAVLAAQVEPGSPGWAVLDAQRRELFAARFSAIDDVAIVPQDQWLAGLKPGELVTGPVLSRLAAELPDGVAAAEESAWAPKAATVAQLALMSPQRISPFDLLPNYFRLSAAEEKLQKEA